MAQATALYRMPAELRGTILEDIVRTKLHEVRGAKLKWPAVSIMMALDRAPPVRPLKRALLRRSPGIIAEIKKASPSAGLLRPALAPLDIAGEYARAGAAAISVVTEGKHFRGSLETLAALRWNCGLSLLLKDFVIDSYQVLEARHAGADAVLLIAALLEDPLLANLRATVEENGMDALVEVHSEKDLDRALEAGATLIGVNSRDLKSFEVSLEVCLRLAPRLPKDALAIAESGIKTSADIRCLAAAGYRGFLVGEQLMRAQSPGAALSGLLSDLQPAKGGAR